MEIEEKWQQVIADLGSKEGNVSVLCGTAGSSHPKQKMQYSFQWFIPFLSILTFSQV